MFNLFKKNKEEVESPLIKISALLIHAAKIDENYTEKEKNIIKKALVQLDNLNSSKIDEIMISAEKKEKESNQIVEFTIVLHTDGKNINAHIVYDDDNFIRLAYRDDNVFSFSTDSIIDFSNQEGLSEHYDFNELDLENFNEEINYTFEQVLTSDPTIQFFAEAAGIQVPFPNEQQVSGGVFNILSDEISWVFL